MRKFAILSLIVLMAGRVEAQSEAPRLVVNIVISQMRYDLLNKLHDNFSDNGFRRFLDGGMSFSNADYNYMMTTTPAGLATLTTGANPSTHGVSSTRWVDLTTSKISSLIEDPNVNGLECDAEIGKYSPRHLTTPTIGDHLVSNHPASRSVCIASDPTSAIVAGGFTSHVYWLDSSRCSWISSEHYFDTLPQWVTKYNKNRVTDYLLEYQWTPSRPVSTYKNPTCTLFEIESEEPSKLKKLLSFDFLRKQYVSRNFSRVLYTPVGNELVGEFAKQAVIHEELGKDENPDLLTVVFDTPRYVGELFGPESMETEDLYYQLDGVLADLIDFIYSQTEPDKVVLMLTSDHGASDTYGDDKKLPMGRFNAAQFLAIMNGFMIAQYGAGDWVVDYCDRQIFLNRPLMFSSGLSIEEVQNRVAAFALQFRGVAHAITSTALQNSYFGDGYGERIQNSFYPRRSGDVTIDLMPGWIELVDNQLSRSGSMYRYDTHVPLIFVGKQIPAKCITRPVDMTDVAPTLAHIMRLSPLITAEGAAIEEVVENFTW